MTIKILQGDCRDRLKELAAGSVHCIVTSPPYYGLRDYGTAQWEGGDAQCEHRQNAGGLRNQGRDRAASGGMFHDAATAVAELALPYRDTCGKCGARRIDSQIGLEATPDEYIQTMVQVFRELKRVLREDGTIFCNLGDSYCSATQDMRYVLREDLTVAELQRVALEVFGVRIAGDEASSEGPLPSVLSPSLPEQEEGRESEVSRGRVKAQLSAPSVSSDSANGGSQPATEVGCDSGPRGQMCLLWRDDTAVSDTGSHQRGRGSPSEEDGALDNQDLPASATRGLPETQIQGSLLQLQLRDRYFRLLSSRQFTDAEIPAAVRACFKASPALKPKDLLLMPARLALALQADGWWIRSEIVWAKPNPMPESVTDRPTSAHEKIYLLTKSARYYYDADAVREEANEASESRYSYAFSGTKGADLVNDRRTVPVGMREFNGTRNLRNVWNVATEPFSGSHFATMPTEIVARCIKAGTSERGCCAQCGKPWQRMQERTAADGRSVVVPANQRHAMDDDGNPLMPDNRIDIGVRAAFNARNGMLERTTTGWSPSCQCGAATVSCTVLDPFAGAGTTGLVADRLQRNAILIELSPAYCAMLRNRITNDAPLFAEVTDAPA